MASFIADHEELLTDLQSDNKSVRKDALVAIETKLFKEYQDIYDLKTTFSEVQAHVLKCFGDSSEACREIAANIIRCFIEHLPKSDYYLTYIIPAISKRIGRPEIVEPSEELRLVFVNLIKYISELYKETKLLNIFFDEISTILAKTATDPFPKVKLVTCEVIVLLSEELKYEFYQKGEVLVKPVLSNYSHQHSKVRVAAIKAIERIVLEGNAKCFEQSITPMAEKLFDESVAVRTAVTSAIVEWMLHLRDRYSYWHRTIPLLLTSLSDIDEGLRQYANESWDRIGKQYIEENDEDLKGKSCFLTDMPDHYPPYLTRPNLGCRTLVQHNIGKIVPAIGRELDGWQEDVKLKSAQLLCWLLATAEDGATQHAPAVIRLLLVAARDVQDPRLNAEVERGAELVGYFISADTWWELIEEHCDHWAGLKILASVIQGAKPQDVVPRVLPRLSWILCFSNNERHQTAILVLVETLLRVCGTDALQCEKELFGICLSIRSRSTSEAIKSKSLDCIEKLYLICDGGAEGLWQRQTEVLAVKSNKVDWSEACSLLDIGGAYIGEALDDVSQILVDVVKSEDAKGKGTVRVLTTLAAWITEYLRSVDTEKQAAFRRVIFNEILKEKLEWKAGGEAEAERGAALAVLTSLLQCGAAEEWKEWWLDEATAFLESMPAIIGGLDERGSETRLLAIDALTAISSLAKRHKLYTQDLLHQTYYPVLKRMQDSVRAVRHAAARSLRSLWSQRPARYDACTGQAHLDGLLAALLVHLDDDDDTLSSLAIEVLEDVCTINKDLTCRKLQSAESLTRNRHAIAHLKAIISSGSRHKTQ